jgi:NAD-dependent SIR2 family protein deacetylase
MAKLINFNKHNKHNNRYTFEGFLSGVPAGDYVFQKTAYDEQIKKAAEIIKNADYVLIGAGAGMSAAAGAQYGGAWFEANFGEFQKKYGKGHYMQDMYSAGFYPFPDEESFWGYWSKQALLGGAHLDVTPLHKTLLELCGGKRLFVLSTNADGQFVKAGLPKEKTFCTQGDYFHIQCRKGCQPKTYEAVELFEKMDRARENCKVPSDMVPKCPVCGGAMSMNLRSDSYFIQDEAWYEAEERFGDFLTEAIESEKKICLLEVGVGFNTPTIIRFPFERLAKENENVSLIRLNLNEAVVPECLGERAVGINEDMKKSIEDLKQYTICGVTG